ncbi:flagellar hook-associated protein FlgK [Solimonas sp. K1W22B-7]|uniref:flagellar hook-associated protein FlgK n=1 Tax=Solimonas sp. K1W22B-7 TaxID=2303331 RepID=UPI000E32FAF8|nr:flagellar hook-associated protein FlgK [Solimonas sp. K1W22B-7]AXQ30398.1 flagellar hook-associated protein FlgK [Solimonas sp. K1W22B-7]
MSDLLSIGVSGLLAYRKALDTAGHNIANVNTPGYSRQRVELGSRIGGPQGDGYIGAGVSSNTVKRLADALVTTRLQGDASAYSRTETFAGLASRVDGWLSDADSGLTKPLQSFYTALSGLSSNPSSSASRQTLLSAGQTLAGRYNDIQSQFDGMETEINQRLSQTADEVTRYAQQVADLNERIVLAKGQAGGQPPNDLLDQRDSLIKEIASRIGITTTDQDDGGINVFTGSGQALVLGRQASALTVGDDAYGSGRKELFFSGGQNITAQTSGGVIGGLLDFRRELLDPVKSDLGRMAAGLAEAMNEQHAQGMDATGQMGGKFFADIGGSVYAARANTGNATVGVALSDAGALTGDDYALSYTGSSWQLTRARDGASVALTGTGTSADPLRAEGLSLSVSGTPAAGDRYLLKPTASAASQLRMAITDTSRVAAASPIRGSAALANTGSATVGELSVADASNSSLRSGVTIQFTGANSYSINGSGSITWAAGDSIEVNGWSLKLSGTPASGDSFTVGANSAGSNDNGNARALAKLSTLGVLNGGSSTLSDAQGAMVGRAGAQAQQASLQLDAQASVRAQTEAEQASLSGVNLDEEAADLIRYQQAYQAAARVIAVANEVFQSLLDAARN